MTDSSAEVGVPDTPLGCPEKEKSGRNSVDVPLRGFKLTISTKMAVTEDDENIISRYLQKQTIMHHLVAEHGSSGRRHLHALMCFDKPRAKRNIADYVWKLIRTRHPDSKQGIAVRVDVLYDDTWYNSYLKKEETHTVISTNYDITLESGYYATPEQQALLQSFTNKPLVRNSYYAKLCDDFNEWWVPYVTAAHPNRLYLTPNHVCKFLYDSMHRDKIDVILDNRRVRQLADYLCRRMLNDSDPSFEDRKYFASLKGPVINYDDEPFHMPPVGNPTGSRRLWSEQVFK